MSGNVLLLVFMFATLIVLVVGIALMVRGGKLNKRFGNKLMSLRVIFQACALAVLALLFYLTKE